MDHEAAQLLANGLNGISQNLKFVGAGAAIAALGGVGTGIGIVFGSFISALGRQPGMEKKLLPITWLAFALTEAMGLFALLIAFIFIFT